MLDGPQLIAANRDRSLAENSCRCEPEILNQLIDNLVGSIMPLQSKLK